MPQLMVVLGYAETALCVFYAEALGVMMLRIYEPLPEMELIQLTIFLPHLGLSRIKSRKILQLIPNSPHNFSLCN